MLVPVGLAAAQSTGSWVSLLPAILGLGLAALGGLGRAAFDRPGLALVGSTGRTNVALRCRRLPHRLFSRPPPVVA
jgi:hypothetical protein